MHGQQNHLWILRGRASARSLWISHGGRRAQGGKRREREKERRGKLSGERGIRGRSSGTFFFFSSLAERAITAVPVTALPLEAIVTSSAMPRFHQAESNNKRKQNKQQPSKTNNATPTRHKPKTNHLSGN